MEGERECRRGPDCHFSLITGKAGVEFLMPFEKAGEEVGLCYLCKRESDCAREILDYGKKKEKGLEKMVKHAKELAISDTIPLNASQEAFDMFERLYKQHSEKSEK